MSVIEIHDLTKRYGDVKALKNLDLSVEKGEVYGFLGHNGAGKSTTINLILGFIRPSSGEARVLGYHSWDESIQIRKRIGNLPEGASVYDRLTGVEHIEFAKELKGTNDDPHGILSRVGLSTENANRYAGEYSKGMKQRLSLGMALVGDPELLILDEPTSGLDPSGMREIREITTEEANDGTTVFFSSHILSEVESICDRVGILHDGELVAQDQIGDLREELDSHSITIQLDTAPQDVSGVRELRGVTGVQTEDETVTVFCESSSVKVDVVRYFDEIATVRNVISEEPTLDSIFEKYTLERSGQAESSEDRAKPSGVQSTRGSS